MEDSRCGNCSVRIMYCQCTTKELEDFHCKPSHYENGGEDFLDRLFRTGIPAEIRGAMRFTIGKYADRLGKKDDQVKELDKIIDYATRYKTHLLGSK